MPLDDKCLEIEVAALFRYNLYHGDNREESDRLLSKFIFISTNITRILQQMKKFGDNVYNLLGVSDEY